MKNDKRIMINDYKTNNDVTKYFSNSLIELECTKNDAK